MTKHTYNKEITALLVVDPYSDFISEGGKLWPRIQGVAEANNCVPHMLEVPERRATGGVSGLLRDASSIPSGRLRNLEVRRARPEGGMAAKEFRTRHMGWRDPLPSSRPSRARSSLQWLRQHRSGFAA